VCASPDGRDLQVGEVMVNASDRTAFTDHPLTYKFQVAGGNFKTDAAFPTDSNGRGTYPYAGRDVTLPDAETYDAAKAVTFGWKIDRTDQYVTPLDDAAKFVGNFGVLYDIHVAVANGTADTPVQVLLTPRGGPFGVGAVTRSAGKEDLITVGPHVFKPPRALLSVGRIPGTQTTPFDLRIMPAAGLYLPVGVIVAPMYTMSVGSVTWGKPAVTAKTDPVFVPN
jgi:hypothetical protein